MKRLVYSILLLLCTYHVSYSRIGCLAKSQDLQQPFDTKTYHPVACTCDCAYHEARGKYSPARNQCLECYHCHDPRPVIFVTEVIKTAARPSFPTIEHASTALQTLINRYRHNHPSIFDK